MGAIFFIPSCQGKVDTPVVGRVGDYAITLKDFKAQAAFMGLGGDPAQLTPELREAVLETMTNSLIIMEQASAQGIEIKPTEVDREVSLLKGELDKESFDRSLASQGLDFEQWKKVVEQELLVRKTFELFLTPRSLVSADEIRSYYQNNPEEFQRPEQVLAIHAVLPNNEMALSVVKGIRSGRDMSNMVRQLGGNLPEGGKPVWLERGRMPENLDQQVFSLKPGNVAGPLASAYGFHVIQVVDKRNAATIPLTEAAEAIQRKLAAAKKQTLATQWVAELRNRAKVWFDPDFLASGRTGKSEG